MTAAHRDLANEAAQACARLLKARVVHVEAPADAPYPRRRPIRTMRVNLRGRAVIAVHRLDVRRAGIEAQVLRALGQQGAPVPKLLAHDGPWLIQEDVGTERLPQRIVRADAAGVERALDAALQAVARCQNAARAAGLERAVRITHEPRLLLAAPERVGRMLAAPPPFLPDWGVIFAFERPRVSFIKWDTRLGNAILQGDGRVVWVDWEECGRGEALRDPVKLLLDEWLPDAADAEHRLWDKHQGAFLGEIDTERGRVFAAVYGTLLALVRLGNILNFKRDGPWWDEEICLAHDLIAVNRAAAERLLRRGARWARLTTVTDGLAPWMEGLVDRLPE